MCIPAWRGIHPRSRMLIPASIRRVRPAISRSSAPSPLVSPPISRAPVPSPRVSPTISRASVRRRRVSHTTSRARAPRPEVTSAIPWVTPETADAPVLPRFISRSGGAAPEYQATGARSTRRAPEAIGRCRSGESSVPAGTSVIPHSSKHSVRASYRRSQCSSAESGTLLASPLFRSRKSRRFDTVGL